MTLAVTTNKAAAWSMIAVRSSNVNKVRMPARTSPKVACRICSFLLGRRCRTLRNLDNRKGQILFPRLEISNVNLQSYCRRDVQKLFFQGTKKGLWYTLIAGCFEQVIRSSCSLVHKFFAGESGSKGFDVISIQSEY
jgi:hypothetical protein